MWRERAGGGRSEEWELFEEIEETVFVFVE